MSFNQPRITPPRKGQAITARSARQPFDSINQLLSGIAPIQQVRAASGSQASVTIARFVITSAAADEYLVCREFDGTAQGDSDVYISRPPMLRASMTSRDGVTYTYTDSQTRTASDGVDTETQVVVPSYLAGDEIYALRGAVRGSGVFSDPNDTRKVEWIDLNIDARAWAATEE